MEYLSRVFQNKKEKKTKSLSFYITQFKIEFLLSPTGCRKVLEKKCLTILYICIYVYIYIYIYIHTHIHIQYMQDLFETFIAHAIQCPEIWKNYFHWKWLKMTFVQRVQVNKMPFFQKMCSKKTHPCPRCLEQALIYKQINIYIYIYIYSIYNILNIYIYNEFYQGQTYINILIQKYNLTSLVFSCSLQVISVASSFESNPFNMRILFRFRNETEGHTL